MEVDLLGPLRVRRGDREIAMAGARLRRLLLRLAVAPDQVVPMSQVIDAVWPDDPPADAPNAVQSLVSRLRRTLDDPSAVLQATGGYRFVIDPAAVDVNRFTTLAAVGHDQLAADDFEAAAATLTAALTLWRGSALVDADDAAYARGPAARLEEQRLSALGDRIEADVRRGLAGQVVGELEELTESHPLHDRFSSLLLRALAATGRAAEAAAGYERVRVRLADELGIDPSSELQAQHLALLRGELDPGAPTSRRARAQRSNLRAQLTTFLGRDDEVKRLDELLGSSRLTTIVGPGGAGKTRLSSEVAARYVERMPGGVWFVELAPVTEEANLGQAFLAAMGLREGKIIERRSERETRDAVERLQDALADVECLLVVDNCEHLVLPVAQLVDRLLAGALRLRVLATSREPLGIAGESLCVLTPLPLPEPDDSAEVALTYPSVQLFDDRGRAVRADFETTDATVEDVIEIVRRLDGLPLAIELAAARLRVLPVGEIATRINDRFRLLTGGSRAAMPRHRTLRAVVEWSWDLLTPPERALAERLAVFPAGVTVESATAVCLDDDLVTGEVPELLDALVDKSLLQVVDGPGLRYRMLETIREYGIERLVEQGVVLAVRTAHARYFAGLVREADPHLRTADQLGWMRQLAAELDNVLAALRFLGDQGETADALELALSLSWFWTMTGNRDEQATWLGFALALPGAEGSDSRTLAEAAYAVSAFDFGVPGEQDDWEERRAELRELAGRVGRVDVAESPFVLITQQLLLFFSGDNAGSAEVAERALHSDDPWVRASMRTMRAAFAENSGDIDAMRVDVAAAYDAFTQIGDRWGLASTLAARAHVRTMDGDLIGAIEDLQASLALQQEIGSTEDELFTGMRLADLWFRLGDHDAAVRELDAVPTTGLSGLVTMDLSIFSDSTRALMAAYQGDLVHAGALRQDLGRRLSAVPKSFAIQGHAKAVALSTASLIDVLAGDLDAAAEGLKIAYPAAVGTKDFPILAMVGVAGAALAVATGRPHDGAVLLGAAARLRGSPDLTDVPISRVSADLRVALGDAYEAAFAEGQSMTRDEAVARLDPAT